MLHIKDMKGHFNPFAFLAQKQVSQRPILLVIKTCVRLMYQMRTTLLSLPLWFIFVSAGQDCIYTLILLKTNELHWLPSHCLRYAYLRFEAYRSRWSRSLSLSHTHSGPQRWRCVGRGVSHGPVRWRLCQSRTDSDRAVVVERWALHILPSLPCLRCFRRSYRSSRRLDFLGDFKACSLSV